MNLVIKNMVCDRCVLIVRQTAEASGIPYSEVKLGEIELNKKPSKHALEKFSRNLVNAGFELLDDKRKQVIEKIKSVIIREIHHSDGDKPVKFSYILAKETHRDYSYLSSLFSEVEGITIEKYIINQRIEKVKELLVYDELTLSEIAWKLGYSSVAHLSAQFKKVTGFTPSMLKRSGIASRKALDKITPE